MRRRLVQMIKDCLRNDPTIRPTAEQLVTALEGMKGIIEGAYGELATIDAVRQVRTVKALQTRTGNTGICWLAEKDDQIQHLQHEIEVHLEPTYA